MRRIKKIVVVALLLVVVAVIGTGFFVYRTFLMPAGKLTEPTVVVVGEGDTLSETAHELEKKGAILNERLFVTAARYLGVDRMIRVGEYKIEPTMSPKDILVMLLKGHVVEYPVTVPEGLNIYQVGDLLAEKGFGERDEFMTTLSR